MAIGVWVYINWRFASHGRLSDDWERLCRICWLERFYIMWQWLWGRRQSQRRWQRWWWQWWTMAMVARSLMISEDTSMMMRRIQWWWWRESWWLTKTPASTVMICWWEKIWLAILDHRTVLVVSSAQKALCIVAEAPGLRCVVIRASKVCATSSPSFAVLCYRRLLPSSSLVMCDYRIRLLPSCSTTVSSCHSPWMASLLRHGS